MSGTCVICLPNRVKYRLPSIRKSTTSDRALLSMVQPSKSADANPRKPKRACLPKIREVQPRKHPPVRDRPGDTSSIVTLQRRPTTGKLKTHERERQRSSAPPNTATPPPNTTTSEGVTSDIVEDSVSATATADVPPKRKRKRVNTTKSKLQEWLDLRGSCLDELLRHDGPLTAPLRCSVCAGDMELFRCRDCGHGHSLLCTKCMVSKHHELELHRVERWNGTFFEKTSLSVLGLRVQLGHDGAACASPIPGPANFLVFDVTGVHRVNIDYCGCQPFYEVDRRIQLLRRQWFPATITRPQTVFTFECLDTFHELTLQAKANLYDFYHVILRKTDNANVFPTIYRYPEMHRAFRLWRNLMAFKRAGRGHDPSGVKGTPPGGLMVECPACPHPGQNLPDDWERAGPLLYLYTLYLAIDANFKLKGKDRNLSDIDLAPGLGAFVHEERYQNYIKDYVDQPEMNTCDSEHDAVVRSSIRNSPGYAVSGAGVVICSRHVLVRKNGAGDLQKGERYCNMDFIALSAMATILVLWVIITYDIGCQWSKNLSSRMQDFPEDMRTKGSVKVDIAIPGWHIKGHGPRCQDNYNLGYMNGTGRTCGDEIEGSWSHTNPLAASVREMGPGARHETLNDHWNGWNFRKVVGLRVTLRKKFTQAAAMKRKHEDAYQQLTSTFTVKQIKQWEGMIMTWENDPLSPNPYSEPAIELMLHDVRLELAKEEASDVLPSNMPKTVSMTGFLTTGLEIEDRQYQLRYEVSEMKHLRTSKQQADVQEKRNALQRQISNWRQAQLVYTPHAATLLSATSQADESPENVNLLLPSSLPPSIRSLSELKRVCNAERRLRHAQALDALAQIRRQRRIIQGLWQFKKINVSGTSNRPNTRVLTAYNRINRKLQRAVYKYHTARKALLILDPNGDWQEELKELRQEDIRGPAKEADESSGRYVMSWIWLTRKAGKQRLAGEEEFNECMRVEWSKARARMKRWQEEFLILQEEMRRVIAWFEWKAGWWEKQAARRVEAEPAVLFGISAYAHKQANLLRCMAKRFANDWIPFLAKHDINPEWAARYPVEKAVRGKVHKEDDVDPEEIEELEEDDGLDIREAHSDGEEEEGAENDELLDFDD